MLGKSENEEGAENEGDPPAGEQNKTRINAAFVLVFFSDEMEIICFFIIIFIVEFAFKLWSTEPRSITNKKPEQLSLSAITKQQSVSFQLLEREPLLINKC